VLECVKEFTRTIVDLYEVEYMRPPNQSELHEIVVENEASGFLGMIGSTYCMHWEWSIYSVAHHGKYNRHKGGPTVILEALPTNNLRV
jgi:hypothetical protein